MHVLNHLANHTKLSDYVRQDDFELNSVSAPDAFALFQYPATGENPWRLWLPSNKVYYSRTELDRSGIVTDIIGIPNPPTTAYVEMQRLSGDRMNFTVRDDNFADLGNATLSIQPSRLIFGADGLHYIHAGRPVEKTLTVDLHKDLPQYLVASRIPLKDMPR